MPLSSSPLRSDPSKALELAVGWWAESGFPRAHGEVGQLRAWCWEGVPLAQLSAKPSGVPQILGSFEALEEVGYCPGPERSKQSGSSGISTGKRVAWLFTSQHLGQPG